MRILRKHASSTTRQLKQATERTLNPEPMKKWICIICGYIYDEAVGIPDQGVPAGTSFESLPDDWTCPECGSPKESFEPYVG